MLECNSPSMPNAKSNLGRESLECNSLSMPSPVVSHAKSNFRKRILFLYPLTNFALLGNVMQFVRNGHFASCNNHLATSSRLHCARGGARNQRTLEAIPALPNYPYHRYHPYWPYGWGTHCKFGSLGAATMFVSRSKLGLTNQIIGKSRFWADKEGLTQHDTKYSAVLCNNVNKS